MIKDRVIHCKTEEEYEAVKGKTKGGHGFFGAIAFGMNNDDPIDCISEDGLGYGPLSWFKSEDWKGKFEFTIITAEEFLSDGGDK